MEAFIARFRDYPKGVHSSEWKRITSKDDDIVRSAWQHAAGLVPG